VKSRKPTSPTKKNSRLGHLHFIYDQNREYPIVDVPNGYLRPISGYVEFFKVDRHDNALEGEREQGTVAGRFDASYIDVDQSLVDGVKLYSMVDTISDETAEIYNALFDPHTNELRKGVKELLGDVTFRNILVINKVEVLPVYRGMGIGLATIWNLIRRDSAGCGIVALKAFPFQFREGGRSGHLGDLEESDWNNRMEYDPYSYTVEFAHEKLIFHLKKLGFKRIGDAGVMALFTSRQIPFPQEIHRWFPRSELPKAEQM